MNQKLEQPGFWLSALLTFMAVMVQTALSMPLTLLDHILARPNEPATQLANQPVVVGFVNIIAFGAAIAVGLILARAPPRRAFPLTRPSVLQLCAMVLTIAGGDLLLSELDNLLRSVATPPAWLIEAYKTLLSPEGGLAGRLFLLVIVAPVTEELLFRGVILRGLLTRFPAWIAVGLTAFLFAAGHVNPWQFGSAFWIGVAFGWFYLRTRSLALCILGHAFSNGLFVFFTSGWFDVPGLTSGPDLSEVVFQPWWLDLTGAILLVIGVMSFLKATPASALALSPPPDPPPIPPQISTSPEPPVIGPPSAQPPTLS